MLGDEVVAAFHGRILREPNTARPWVSCQNRLLHTVGVLDHKIPFHADDFALEGPVAVTFSSFGLRHSSFGIKDSAHVCHRPAQHH